jgi:hypothetical protein
MRLACPAWLERIIGCPLWLLALHKSAVCAWPWPCACGVCDCGMLPMQTRQLRSQMLKTMVCLRRRLQVYACV